MIANDFKATLFLRPLNHELFESVFSVLWTMSNTNDAFTKQTKKPMTMSTLKHHLQGSFQTCATGNRTPAFLFLPGTP